MKLSKYGVFGVVVVLVVAVVALSACQQQGSQEVNVLCTPAEEWCIGVKQEFEAAYGIQVNYVRLSAGDSLARLRSEADNPQFDLWWGGSIDSYIPAKAEGLLATYASPNFANLRDQQRFRDPDNTWAAFYVGSLAFGTNTEWLAANPGVEPPRSWDDLLRPEFKGQIMVAHPAASGTAYTMLATILQMRGEEEGWAYMQQLSDQILQFTRSGIAPAMLAGEGEVAIGIAFSHVIAQAIEDAQLPLVMTFPEEGTGYEIGALAVVQGAQNLDAAQKLFDWTISPAWQQIGTQYGNYAAPTVQGVEHSIPELLEVNLIDYDFAWAAANKDALIQRFINEVATADNLRQ